MRRPWMNLARLAMAGLFALLVLTPGSGVQAKTKLSSSAESGLLLIMFEQDGCHYCEVWDANIGVSYDKTREGKFAPLKKVDIHVDDDIENVRPVIFTPTFVLYKDGREVGRLTGYISDDFFWGLLNPMLKKHGYKDEIQESKASELKARIK